MQDRDAARRRREEALSALARTPDGPPGSDIASAPEQPQPPIPIFLAPRSRRPSVRTSILVGAAILVIAGGVGAYRLRFGQSASISTPGPAQLSVALRAAGLSCPSDAVWSPDGKHIALLGYSLDACFDPFATQPQPGLLLLYDVTARELIMRQVIQPDSAILQRLPIAPAVQRAFQTAHLTALVNLYYQRALWSPDGSQLAVVFQADVPNGAPVTSGDRPIWPTKGLDGLALYTSDGTLARIVTAPPDFPDVWDLSGGTLSRLPSAASSDAFVLPPALGYQWSSGDLTAQQPLNLDTPPAAGVATGPVGVPASGGAFALWQPGTARLRVQNTHDTLETPGVYVWETQPFAAWSADGRYLAPSLYERALLVPAGQTAPSARQRADFAVQAYPLAAPRDAAMQQLLDYMPTGSNAPFAQSVDLAWRPDGRYLAELPPYESQNAASYAVTLYDTATGRRVTTLDLPAVYGNAAGGGPFLRWSADGQQLLLASGDVGIMVVWGPSQLPK